MAQVKNRLTPFFENITFDRDDNELILNFGPQHPSAHGQLRLMLHLQQEQIVKAHPDVGYLHRGMEKMAENMIYNEFSRQLTVWTILLHLQTTMVLLLQLKNLSV
jgi:NADH-quinone oxidoreductase subunit D